MVSNLLTFPDFDVGTQIGKPNIMRILECSSLFLGHLQYYPFSIKFVVDSLDSSCGAMLLKLVGGRCILPVISHILRIA